MHSPDNRMSDADEPLEKLRKREELKKQLGMSKNEDSLADGKNLKSM